jgi:hypothetical protein
MAALEAKKILQKRKEAEMEEGEVEEGEISE